MAVTGLGQSVARLPFVNRHRVCADPHIPVMLLLCPAACNKPLGAACAQSNTSVSSGCCEGICGSENKCKWRLWWQPCSLRFNVLYAVPAGMWHCLALISVVLLAIPGWTCPTLVLLLPLSLLLLPTQAAASTTSTRAKRAMTVAISNVCFSLKFLVMATSSFTAIQPRCGT